MRAQIGRQAAVIRAAAGVPPAQGAWEVSRSGVSAPVADEATGSGRGQVYSLSGPLSAVRAPYASPIEYQRGDLPDDGTVRAERLANPDEIALYTQDQAAPVAIVTAKGIIRSPAELDGLRRIACWHTERVPVLLLVHPFDHVADLCTGCGKAFPDEAYLTPTSGW
jgi:hypothetical protein